MASKKKIIILGSTGSIGVNALTCVDNAADLFDVVGLSTNQNVNLLVKQAARYSPEAVAVTAPMFGTHKAELEALDIPVFSGPSALVDLVRTVHCDLLVNAVVGAAGFMPTLKAIQNGADIALANKETLVIGGQFVLEKVREQGVQLLPIDSEHSAIFQSLIGENYSDIEEILLTASGGPFRSLPKSAFKNVRLDQALRHPNWNMGKKITIDSATMMNKGLEIIEARWLFGVPVEKIRVVIHPQSIIHSMVCFHDGSIKAQLGVPDMRVPIQFAMTYPQRHPSNFPRIDWQKLRQLTFDTPDLEKFRCLALAITALKSAGTAPAVLNAANERAVAAFLSQKITFEKIPKLIEDALERHDFVAKPSIEDLLYADDWARTFVDKGQ